MQRAPVSDCLLPVRAHGRKRSALDVVDRGVINGDHTGACTRFDRHIANSHATFHGQGADDPAALAVLREAGAELAVLARALIAREGPRDVVVLGRAAGLHPAILDAMREELPGVALRMEITDAALAAARLACARARPGAG